MTKLSPLSNRVVVKRDEAETKTPGGLFIPETAKEKACFGTVLFVGRGKVLDNGQLREPQVKPGDRVLFAKYVGTEVELEGDKLLVMSEDELLTVVES